MYNKNKGFSLVELSIVLIIISLLVASIVSGKSLITGAKLTVLNTEMQTLRIAVGSYVYDNGISNYSNTITTGVTFYDLVKNAYLEEGTIMTSENTECTVESNACVYKSKQAGSAWGYAGTSTDVVVSFGALTSAITTNNSPTTFTISTLKTETCNTFKSKYDRNEMVSSTCDVNGTTGNAFLTVTFSDIKMEI